ncbi:tetratricopeptide repeat-containing sensor histidine kinase [Chitinophaga lutea]
MNVRPALAVFGIIALLLTASCGEPPASRKASPPPAAMPQGKDYLSVVISLDTLASDAVVSAIYREDSLLSRRPDSASFPFFHYFRARRLLKENRKDSAMETFRKMKVPREDDDAAILRNFSLLDYGLVNGMTAESATMEEILAEMKTAERLRSRLAYKYYDLMAKAYFRNDHFNESLEYAERYFKSHPYRAHPVVMQRHYDVSFLLASKMEDFDKMMLYNTQQRRLAYQIGDSLAIARSYDSESQMLARQGHYAKALAASKAFVDYLDRTGHSSDIAYNNLATSFIHHKQPDSAIHYFGKAIRFARQYSNGDRRPGYYKGLADAYHMKRDYQRALEAVDSAYAIEVRQIRNTESVKIAEIREKYEAGKKDQNIRELSSRNALNEKVIRQQRWMLGLALLLLGGGLGFGYFLHRQYRLTERNKLLQSENSRLSIEQKLLQAQLNPHFIFNSIANLQSLVASGDTKESVRYLSVFSGLLRNVLEQSRRDFIPLEEEVTSLENYLQLQQMRYAGLFDYSVEVAEGIHPQELLIPPMLVQPFAENAIEHGFRNIGYKGMLRICFQVRAGQLHITVEDNGQGIVEKGPGEQKKQSLAQTILKERLQVLFQPDCQRARFEIENKSASGGRGVSAYIVIPAISD